MSSPVPPSKSDVSGEWDGVDASHLDNALAEIKSPPYKSFDINFFSQKSRKSTLLVGNGSDRNFIHNKKGWLDFDFANMLYVSEIEMFASGFQEDDEAEFSFVDAFSNSERTSGAKFSGGSFRISVHRFMRGFGLKPPIKPWGHTQIQSISVTGLELSQLVDVIDSFDQIEKHKQKVWEDAEVFVERAQAAESQTEIFRQENENLQAEKQEIQNETVQVAQELEKLKAQRQNGLNELDAFASQTKALQVSKAELEDQLEIKTQERTLLNNEATNAQSKLSELQRNIHLFPSEISGYVQQGSNNVTVYVAIMAIPLLVIVAVMGRLFWNAEEILSAYIKHPEIPIISYLLSRVPYVTVSTAILAVCYYVLRTLFAEIISINRRKQELYKVSIIATDVSFASLDGLNLTEEETYNLRTKTKMELLKEHLKQNLSQDYVYSPPLILGKSPLLEASLNQDNNSDEVQVKSA